MKVKFDRSSSLVLVRMLSDDQGDLQKFRSGDLTKAKLEIRNYRRFRKLRTIAARGFPNILRVGTSGYVAGLAITLHSGELNFMKSYLKRHSNQVASAVDPKHRAVLIDKILTIEGKPQHYGTQFFLTNDGKLELLPVDSLDSVGKRRKHLGLETIDEFKSSVHQQIEQKERDSFRDDRQSIQ